MHCDVNIDFFFPEINMRCKEIRGPFYVTSEICGTSGDSALNSQIPHC